VDVRRGLVVASAAEFAVDHRQRQIEELDGDAALADIDADRVGTFGAGRDE
jgi:hypothetical protein